MRSNYAFVGCLLLAFHHFVDSFQSNSIRPSSCRLVDTLQRHLLSPINASQKSDTAIHANQGADEKNHFTDIKRPAAYKQQTPHSSRHFLPSHPAYKLKWYQRLIPQSLRPVSHKTRTKQRFMEGWYYRLTLPKENVSFAFIFSIEDAGRKTHLGGKDLRLCGAQVMGPNDEYLVQTSPDDTKFW